VRIAAQDITPAIAHKRDFTPKFLFRGKRSAASPRRALPVHQHGVRGDDIPVSARLGSQTKIDVIETVAQRLVETAGGLPDTQNQARMLDRSVRIQQAASDDRHVRLQRQPKHLRQPARSNDFNVVVDKG
jgi:hypothetical protein